MPDSTVASTLGEDASVLDEQDDESALEQITAALGLD
jgi:hypothetical protein